MTKKGTRHTNSLDMAKAEPEFVDLETDDTIAGDVEIAPMDLAHLAAHLMESGVLASPAGGLYKDDLQRDFVSKALAFLEICKEVIAIRRRHKKRETKQNEYRKSFTEWSAPYFKSKIIPVTEVIKRVRADRLKLSPDELTEAGTTQPWGELSEGDKAVAIFKILGKQTVDTTVDIPTHDGRMVPTPNPITPPSTKDVCKMVKIGVPREEALNILRFLEAAKIKRLSDINLANSLRPRKKRKPRRKNAKGQFTKGKTPRKDGGFFATEEDREP